MGNKSLSVFKQYRLTDKSISLCASRKGQKLFCLFITLGCKETEDTNEIELRDLVVKENIHFQFCAVLSVAQDTNPLLL